ncbi:MAG: hypothetical protein A2020_03515 [Lentisphaerae bacterium GWF2_45_14]|nr:MAG: hypothetical protein A2020_03515 [Lentisphaerae bacterium GWF2_45_14]
MEHKRKFMAALAIVFVSGAVIGVAVGFATASWMNPRHSFRSGAPSSPEKMNERLCEKLAEGLELNDVQRADLNKKLPPALTGLFSKHIKMRSEMRNAIENVLKELTPPLNKGQLKLLDERRKKHER